MFWTDPRTTTCKLQIPGMTSSARFYTVHYLANCINTWRDLAVPQLVFPESEPAQNLYPTKSFGWNYKPRSPDVYMHGSRSYMHVKDPVVHVRVRWIMETLKIPACTVGWVARPCRRRVSTEKRPEFPMGDISVRYTAVKSKQTEKKKRLNAQSTAKVISWRITELTIKYSCNTVQMLATTASPVALSFSQWYTVLTQSSLWVIAYNVYTCLS